jgi:outer membrane protein OmpA-like peptidoglycan-associated protein
LTPDSVTKGKIKAESFDFFADDVVSDNTIVSFTIGFRPNQHEFSTDQYAAEFERAVKSASTFGNAAVVITGHSDPTKTLVTLIRAGMTTGAIKRTGTSGNYNYYLNGKPLDPTRTKEVIALIDSGVFDSGSKNNPRAVMQAALNLSHSRAKAVKESLAKFAKMKNIKLDLTQIVPVGAGISDPVIPKPSSAQEAGENMRVEFKIIKVPAEALEDSEFDF